MAKNLDELSPASAQSKASRIRRKIRDGEELRDGEQEFLDEYEARKNEPVGDSDSGGAADVGGGELPPLGLPAAASQKQERKRGRKQKPGAKKGSGGKRQRRAPSDWRDKEEYKGARMDRETLCVQGAAYYCGFLLGANARIAEFGGRPLPEALIHELIFPATIACLDDWLPEIQAAPETIVAVSGAYTAFEYFRSRRAFRAGDVTVEADDRNAPPPAEPAEPAEPAPGTVE